VSLSDPELVREQYATEAGLAARKSVYQEVTGPDPREIVFDAIAEVGPRWVLDVGCGQGELAERLQHELGVKVTAIDQSERMVELTRARGVDARVGDVQDLPFPDESFDVAVAAWMLYHVPDLERGLGELARVLLPGGRLVAATNHTDHLLEMFELVGARRWEYSFGGHDAEALLRSHFGSVEEKDASGTVTFRDPEAIRTYLRSAGRWAAFAERVPELDEPVVARRRPVVFVADKAA
jgi:SAM-dependent methyltransferase